MKKAPKALFGFADFSAITVISGSVVDLDTVALFDGTFSHGSESPIDQFLLNANELSLIYVNAGTVSRVLGTPILLGYISAVESYVRALIRGLINIDEVAQITVEPKGVPFGAAMNHPKHLLPEALLEEFSLAGPDNLKKTFNSITGLVLPKGLARSLDEFGKLCQLRHCCTHRFGKLGTINAIELGLANHRALLEKPLALGQSQLNDIAESIRTFVKSLNNEIFGLVLRRTVTSHKPSGQKTQPGEMCYSVCWSWDYRRDRARFSTYYNLFATHEDPIPSPPMKEMYERFRTAYKDFKVPQKPAKT